MAVSHSAKVPQLQITARTSSFAFQGREIGIPEIAQQLHVAHVLEGSATKALEIDPECAPAHAGLRQGRIHVAGWPTSLRRSVWITRTRPTNLRDFVP